MKSGGKIIKNFSENNFNFIITNNSVIGDSNIEEEFYFDLNVSDPNHLANCTVPKGVNSKSLFNISCEIPKDIFYAGINDEFEILEEPFDGFHYFTGFKGKKTLTLYSGHIIKNKDDDRKFYITRTNIIPTF